MEGYNTVQYYVLVSVWYNAVTVMAVGITTALRNWETLDMDICYQIIHR